MFGLFVYWKNQQNIEFWVFFFNRTRSKTFNKKYQDSSGLATKASPDQAKKESLIIYKQD